MTVRARVQPSAVAATPISVADRVSNSETCWMRTPCDRWMFSNGAAVCGQCPVAGQCVQKDRLGAVEQHWLVAGDDHDAEVWVDLDIGDGELDERVRPDAGLVGRGPLLLHRAPGTALRRSMRPWR